MALRILTESRNLVRIIKAMIHAYRQYEMTRRKQKK